MTTDRFEPGDIVQVIGQPMKMTVKWYTFAGRVTTIWFDSFGNLNSAEFEESALRKVA